MSTKLIPWYLLGIVIFATAGRTFGQTTAPADDTTANSTLPSMGDLATIIDKATTPDQGESRDWSTPVQLVIIFTGLAVLPSLLMMMTSFTRIVIVLAFLRRALGTQSIPPTVALIGLALFLTLYTMSPTFAKINETSIKPYLADQIDTRTASVQAGQCLKEFMLRQCRESDLALFVQMAKIAPPARRRSEGGFF